MWSVRTSNHNTMRNTHQRNPGLMNTKKKTESEKPNTRLRKRYSKKTMVIITEEDRTKRLILRVCGMNSKTLNRCSRQPYRVCQRYRDHSVMMPSSLLGHNVRKDNNNIIVIIIVITSLPQVPSCVQATPSYNESGTHD